MIFLSGLLLYLYALDINYYLSHTKLFNFIDLDYELSIRSNIGFTQMHLFKIYSFLQVNETMFYNPIVRLSLFYIEAGIYTVSIQHVTK